MEERYLYEYDYDKPELTDECLEHHGILGMKWGKRNGPPYPLDGKISTGNSLRQRWKKRKVYKNRVKSLKKARKIKAKVSEERKESAKTKEEIMKSKDLKAMNRNLDKFSNSEIQSVLDRIDKEQKFSEYLAKQNKSSLSRSKKIKDTLISNIKAGAKSGAEQTIKLVAKNATKLAINEFAKKMAGEEREELIKKLFKEEKK